MSIVENSLGKLVSITYKDGTESVTKTGRLVDIENGILILETWGQRFYIQQSSVIAIIECLLE